MRRRGHVEVTGVALVLALAASGAAAAPSTTGVDFSQAYLNKTVSLGFGGAYRALADATGAMVLNPAGVAQRKGQISVGGEYLHSGFLSSSVVSVSLVDFKATEAVALGVGWDMNRFSPGGQVTVHQFTAAGATVFGEMVYVGMNAKGYYASTDSPLVKGPKGLDMDLGFLVKPIPMLSLAFTLHNLFLGLKQGHEEFPFLMGFGAGLTLNPVARIDIDVTRNFRTSAPNKINAYFGGEFRLAEGVFFRGGFGLDEVQDNNFISAGMTVSGPQVGLNFTFSNRLNPSDQTYAAGVDLKF